MSGKRSMTEKQIAAQELRIPDIALKAFSNAFKTAMENGAAVLVAKDGQLFEVTSNESRAVRTLDTYGRLKSGTRLRIKAKAAKAVS